MGERVDQNAVEMVLTVLGVGRTDGRGQQSAGLEGRILRVGQVEECELGARALAEPALQERRDAGLGGGPGLRSGVVFRERPGGEIGAGMGGANGDEEAGRFKAEDRAVEAGRGHACHLLRLVKIVGFGDGERGHMAVDESDGGRLAVGKFDGEAKAEARTGQAQLVLADLVEEPRAVAQDDGHAGDRVPDHVAKAAQAGEGDADLVPVGVQRQFFGGSNGQQALRGGRDDAGVGDVKWKAGAGRERLGEGNGGLVKLAGVVGVGVERGHGKGNVACRRCECAPS